MKDLLNSQIYRHQGVSFSMQKNLINCSCFFVLIVLKTCGRCFWSPNAVKEKVLSLPSRHNAFASLSRIRAGIGLIFPLMEPVVEKVAPTLNGFIHERVACGRLYWPISFFLTFVGALPQEIFHLYNTETLVLPKGICMQLNCFSENIPIISIITILK